MRCRSGWFFHLGRPAAVQPVQRQRRVSRHSDTWTRGERFHAKLAAQDAELGPQLLAQRAPTSTTCSGPVYAAARATRSSPPTTRPSSTTRRASSTCSARQRSTPASTRFPDAQNIASPEEHRLARSRGQIYQHAESRSAASITKRASHGARSPIGATRRRATPSPSSTAASTMACRCRSRTARPGFTRSAGWSEGERSSPLAAFYFGAFRNNYVDDRPEKRYREMESFPGF